MVVTTATSLPPFPSFLIIIPSNPQIYHSFHPYQQPIITSVLPPRATLNTPFPPVAQMGCSCCQKAKPPENSDQIVSSVSDNGDGVSVVISVLLSIAFVGLSVLTIGVIYIAVTDYLQKREKEKFEKEEAEKAKRGGKKKRVRPRVGPKGFGQKIADDDDL